MEHKDYIERLRAAILCQFGADAQWIGSVFVGEYSKTETMWEQQIEVFELRNHSEAKRCYAWVPNDGSSPEPITVLEVPPVGDGVGRFHAKAGVGIDPSLVEMINGSPYCKFHGNRL